MPVESAMVTGMTELAGGKDLPMTMTIAKVSSVTGKESMGTRVKERTRVVDDVGRRERRTSSRVQSMKAATTGIARNDECNWQAQSAAAAEREIDDSQDSLRRKARALLGCWSLEQPSRHEGVERSNPASFTRRKREREREFRRISHEQLQIDGARRKKCTSGAG